MTDDSDPVVHLQRAAREMIAAARGMLDAAEQLVDDPKTAGDAVAFVTSFIRQAADASSPTPTPTEPENGNDEPADGGGDDKQRERRVQRIEVD